MNDRSRAPHYVPLLTAFLCAGCTPETDAVRTASDEQAPATVDTARIAALDATHADWLTHGGTYAEQRYSALDAVNVDTIARLGLAWYVDLDTSRGQEGTPLVVDGTMYATTAWSKVYAVDAASGNVLWTYDPKVPGAVGRSACCDVVNRGAAYYEGKVFVGTLDGRLIALDAKSGALRWSTQTLDTSKPYTITGAPRAAKGKVFIGNGGAEYGVRGYVSAYDANTGELAWRFYTVPGDPDAMPEGAASDEALGKIAQQTWFGDAYFKMGGGGTVWDSIVYDPELDRLYIGTGNGSPWNRRLRSEGRGDNLFLSSIVALDPQTGKYLWHYQETPGETWDFTAAQQITLATLEIDGARRQAILHAPKNGFFYVIDRRTGRPISAEKFVPVNWAERIDLATGRPIENPAARFENAAYIASSGAAGAHNWHSMSFSPKTGLVYVPAQQIPFVYTDDARFEYRPGEWNLGVDMLGTKLPRDAEGRAAMLKALEGRLIAWDPVAQREVWRVDYDGPWNGGTLATAGGLVFQGTRNARFKAYRADDGADVWDFDAQNAIIAAPISYAVGGEQYVAVMVGNGGGLPLTLPAFEGPGPRLNGRIMAFKLGGSAALPPISSTVAAPLEVDTESSAASVEAGAALYARYCATCHGMETLSAGVLPDLRRSPMLASAAAWRSVVIDGALVQRGMVSFTGQLTPADAESIRAYVADEAARALAAAQ
jgi:alcohol dehydrogenase (cytochrome c)/quinohemoprotein ethanol dehydrogenase